MFHNVTVTIQCIFEPCRRDVFFGNCKSSFWQENVAILQGSNFV